MLASTALFSILMCIHAPLFVCLFVCFSDTARGDKEEAAKYWLELERLLVYRDGGEMM